MAHLELDDLETFLLECEQLHQSVLRDFVLDQPKDQVGRRHRRLDTEQLEMLMVAGVVDSRDDALDAVLLLRHLADEDVVLVVAGYGDYEVGPLDPSSLQDP